MIGTDIGKAAQLLQSGEVVAIPTETVYGLAANAFDAKAVAQIFKVKNRPFFDPLIVHTNSLAKIEDWVEEIPSLAQQVAKTFWPGPLTIVLKKKPIIPDLVTAGNPTVAVRIPHHHLTLQLLELLDFPVAAPSANPFGYVSPTTAQHVADQLGADIPYILDGGACSVGIESTIISFAKERPVVLRLGGTPLEKLKQILGDVDVDINQHSNPQAPGQTDSHYAPKTKFIVGDVNFYHSDYEQIENIGAITLSQKVEWLPPHQQIQLSKNGNLEEAASNIFAAMRILDKKGLQLILAETMPSEGLGRAINDRLRRAAHRL